MQINYIPFGYTDTMLKQEFIHAFESFLDNKRYILDKQVAAFEKAWAAYCESKYAIGVGNGYDAINLCIKALELGSNDEVIVPAHTFAASVLPILNCGAKPVLVDANPDTFNIDSDLIEKSITKNTKAIMAVHLYGNPCDMNALCGLCEQHNLHLIEDNAQAQGARFNNRKTGSFGQLAAASFYPVKNLGALGDGGAVNTNDPELFNKLSLLRTYGSPDKHEFRYLGVNSRLDELQAAFLNIKLKYLDEWNTSRRKIAGWYDHALSNIDELKLLTPTKIGQPVYHIYPVITDRRESLKTYLLEKGIQTMIHYPKPYHLEKAFACLGYKQGDFPVTEQLCNHELSLPIFPGLHENEVMYVCDQVKAFFSR